MGPETLPLAGQGLDRMGRKQGCWLGRKALSRGGPFRSWVIWMRPEFHEPLV